ncbi:alpha-glucuronidase family glycosyl hydrolase [Pontibacter sp. SGAir0037]|uniref:alpha-glucuronidase family glycosyl hydrolase n=1 Tax=Pontibacter sp. SGAir0037 TaxID=2571030 RepID=UPI0010CD1226|nr:alpha-glucuronidase family glycosyl hydrolase [Pontibacter sp. SGAir0037]QCR25216.1 alpha-glucuronidase [Pontibacter sp. SGAir0037]
MFRFRLKHVSKRRLLFVFLFVIAAFLPGKNLYAESGYRLWLRYDQVKDPSALARYQAACKAVMFSGDSPTIAVAKEELINGLSGLLGKTPTSVKRVTKEGTIVVGTPKSSTLVASLKLDERLNKLGKEGFLILTTTVHKKKTTVITANEDIGLLYGVFHFLRLMQSGESITNLSIENAPKLQHRMLNHWDNLDRTVERGYAGPSIWNWETLPGTSDQRYIDYARANASIGINGTVLNNVNADPKILTQEYLLKVQALANAFRPYGIKVYLTPVFSAPIKVGGLKTADPSDPSIIAWWNAKVAEIYQYIPDFGGFCVKANSEGQPGPQDYGRTHADGANMLASAVAPHGGIVMWRAFVYNNKATEDRTKEAYKEFKPLDGQFASNVFVQVKNGPIDFQPREPFNALFGAMPQTPLMLEFQITQEYLGFSTHLVYLGTLYEETLQADTYAKGKGSTIAKNIKGELHSQRLTGMAGVANIGMDSNWTGHPFGQANWYAYGRFAWNPELSAEKIADEWLRLTFTSDEDFVAPVKRLMMASRETAVNYKTPLGLTMLMDISHYRPAPWRRDKPAPVGTKESFHRADRAGIGFDRTTSGSDAVSQYLPEVKAAFDNVNATPEELLLWFHHVPWTHKMNSGRILWEELCYRYYAGVDSVRAMQKDWDSVKSFVDPERFHKVQSLLAEQEKEAVIWRDANVLYFQTFSKMPIPHGLERPVHSLEFYKRLKPNELP